MTIIQSANITLELFSCVICLILLFCMITDRQRKEQLNAIFISLVSCHIPLLIVDAMIFALEGHNESKGSFIFKPLYFLSFTLGSMLLILFTKYLITFLGLKAKVSKSITSISYAAIFICVINIILIIVTQFNGMYYTVANGNTVFLGDFYWISQLLAMICFILNTGIMILYRKCFTQREILFLLSYVTLPALALVFHNIVDVKTAAIDVAITLTILVFYAGIHSEQAKQLSQKELELTDARISIMLSQIQPHFLYNALNTIGDLCVTDPEQAQETVFEFADYLRVNMDSLTVSGLIPFEKELSHVKTYLALEQKRFSDRLRIEYDIQKGGFHLPPLTIQPIVENAVLHGISVRYEMGTVLIKTQETTEGIEITVADDGVGFDPTALPVGEKTHLGIENVRHRVESMCKGSLTVVSAPGRGTTVIILMPHEEVDK